MKVRSTARRNVLAEGEGPAVVMLHGALSSKLQWYFLMKALSPRFRVIAPDLQGYGESPFPTHSENYRLMDEVRHIEWALKEVLSPAEPFHLVGHSYGGATALRMAHEQEGLGKRVLSLSLYEPVAFHLLPLDDEALREDIYVAEQVKIRVDQGDVMGAVRFFAEHWNGPEYFDLLPKMMRTALAAVIKKLPLDFNALFHEPAGLADYRETIRQPVLLMAGEASPRSARKLAERLNATLRDSRLLWLNAGHLAPVLNAGEVNALIQHFLEELSGSPRRADEPAR